VNPKASAGEWARESPYDRFFDFIAPDADRYVILSELLKSLGLNAAAITVEGGRHFFGFPPQHTLKSPSGLKIPFRGKSPVILVAHYDRAPCSPGANDNSAAVFQLLKAALRLGGQEADYWMIIFTDKEELCAGEAVTNQGAFSLAEKLKALGLGDARVFIFDACGTGDTLIVSSTTDILLRYDERPAIRNASRLLTGLRNHALDSARSLHIERILSLATPFSDDAGFLRAGFPAQTITVLPTGEAGPYAVLLRRRPEFAESLINGAARSDPDHLLIPETWRCLNGPADTHLRLTPEHYERVIRFAVGLCRV
jgi:hypothetical protein